MATVSWPGTKIELNLRSSTTGSACPGIRARRLRVRPISWKRVWTATNRRSATGGLGRHELEVQVVEARPHDLEAVQPDALLLGPACEPVEDALGVGRADRRLVSVGLD